MHATFDTILLHYWTTIRGPLGLSEIYGTLYGYLQ